MLLATTDPQQPDQPAAVPASAARSQAAWRAVLEFAALSFGAGRQIVRFPAVPGERPGQPPLRRALITGVDGRAIGQPGAGELVRHWLGQQLPPYRPRAIEVTAHGLLIRYPYSSQGS